MANPEIVFDQPGTYTIRLIAVYDNSTAEKTKTITIRPSVAAGFSTDRDFICTPSRISFTGSGSGSIVNYQWNFGDSSPVENNTVPTTNHTYDNYGNFTATLKCTNTFGCNATYSKLIKVERPVISASITNTDGCVPVSTAFSTNITLPPGSTVSNYVWNFGDAVISNTNTGSINHTYNNPGSYQPSLTIHTSDGCSNTYNFDSVKTGTPPTNLVAYPLIPVFCGSEAGQFIARATNADSYEWNFGGNSSVTVRDTFVEHKFSSLGIKTVTVTPKYNNCPGPTISMQVEVIGVIANFNYQNTCSDKKTFSFNNTSDGNLSSIIWRFGDQTPSVTIPDPVHRFPQSGAFRTKLLVEDNITGCIDSAFARIYTANPVLNNPDTSICINRNTRFRLSSNYTNPAALYTWEVIGSQVGPTTDPLLTLTADSLGNFNNNFVVIDNGNAYCKDTIQLDHNLTVRGPMLDFDMPASICLNTPLTVRNLSQPFQPTDTIKTWYWNFGRFPLLNDSSFEPQPYQYSSHKTYNVKLTAIDKFGCRDSLIKPVAVRPMPFLWIIPRVDTLCLGQRDSIIAYTSDNVLWTPSVQGPAFCNTCDSTMVNPTQTTSYLVTSTNSYNCSVSDSALVKVYQPFTATLNPTSVSLCEGERIQLSAAPADKKITWSPPTGLSNTNVFNPMAAPTNTTIYRASLEDSAGCFSSYQDIRLVVNPKPQVNAGPNKILPYFTQFNFTPDYSLNARLFQWSPPDSLSCSNCPNPTAIATRMKTYTLTVTSDSGCIATDQITIAVQCNNAYILMPSAFTPDNDGRNDNYYPITRGIKFIKRFSLYNRSGQLVYNQENFTPNKSNLGWNGKLRSIPQPAATYVYIIEAFCETGELIDKKGSFILIR